MNSLFIGRQGSDSDTIDQYGNFTMDYFKIYDKVIEYPGGGTLNTDNEEDMTL